MNLENESIIPIKVNKYDELFYEFDYKKLDSKRFRDDIDLFILDSLKSIKYNNKLNLILEIYMPKTEYSLEKEQSSIKAINRYYKSKIEFDDKIKKFALVRIISYVITSIFLAILWFYVNKTRGDSFLTTILDTAATVVLWQVMSVVFIESKNYTLYSRVNRALGNIKVIFKYIDQI